jgi:competence protein ComEC
MFYFGLDFEPKAYMVLLFSAPPLIGTAILKRWTMLTLLLAFMLGMLSGIWRTHNVACAKLTEPMEDVRVTGRVHKNYPLESGTKLILTDTRLYPMAPKRLDKVQLSIKTQGDDYSVGDYVRLYANLRPVSDTLFPGRYNFARHAYFERLAASGFAISQVKLVKHDERFTDFLERARLKIMQRIMAADIKHPQIAIALMVGEQKAISKDILKEMRTSGLTHILSVSGMHLSLVSIICFFVIRYTLSNFVSFAQRYNTKKIAAWVALLATFGYLLISGMQVAAVRSFIMVAFIIAAVLLDRESDARRSVCFAGLVILICTPEAVLHPSFQMSFSAVIALVSLYEVYAGKRETNLHILSKVTFYATSTIFSSLIAGLATSMFVIYHFGNYSNYSLPANLLVSPIVSILIMPALIATFLLLPFGSAYKLPLILMDMGVDLMVRISKYVSYLPKASVMLPPVGMHVLLIFTVGFLWLCLWQARWRFVGLIPIAISLMMLMTARFPSMLVDAKYKTVVLKQGNYLTTFIDRKRPSDWYADQWLSVLGATDWVKEDLMSQEIDYQGYRVNLNFGDDDTLHTLDLSNGIASAHITSEELERNGSYFIYLNPRHIKLVHTVTRSNRPWNQ